VKIRGGISYFLWDREHNGPCERLLGQNDGPMLEALKRLNGGTIHLPNRDKDRPDRDRLALRFERFKVAA
jgi:putative restriction endonuclease